MEKGAGKPVKGKPEGGPARDRIAAVAADLFYRKGIRALGVEEIVKQAGVGKISLYRNFGSKDDLVVAYLEDRNADFWRQWDAAFSRYEDGPSAQLRAIMTYVVRRTTQPGYRRCPFINYAAEFPELPIPDTGSSQPTNANGDGALPT